MKSRILVLSVIVFCLIVFIYWHNMNSPDLTINQDNSYFMDFYVEKNIVHIKCVLSISNHTKCDLAFLINAESEEDVRTGLLINRHLHGINPEDDSDLFSIAAGKTQEFTIDFQGEFNEKLLKKDRLLPDSILLEICNSNDPNWTAQLSE